MRIIVAPDSYKGSLPAVAAAEAMERGISEVFPNALVTRVPVADGGEGTVNALVAGTGGKLIKQRVMGPMGDSVDACWGILGDGQTGVVEVASASGLQLIPPDERNPLIATSFGTGELICAALDYGLRNLIIGLGGSATNDGGAGLLQALGARFLDEQGCELPLGGKALSRLEHIDLANLHSGLASATLHIASDVTNPLCGPSGASFVYGPQKGATPEMIEELDAALCHFAKVARQSTGRAAQTDGGDTAERPGAGAAGGIGAGLMYFAKVRVRPGIEMVLETVDFESQVKKADLVITGEGNTDAQTAFGKAPIGVAAIAKRYGVLTLCISGGLSHGYEEIFSQGIDAVMSLVPGPMGLEECVERAPDLLAEATANAMRIIRLGSRMDTA